MPKFSDMKFTDKDRVPVNFATLKERGPRAAPPQPGHGYIWQLPKITLEDDNWDEKETEAGRRLVYNFRDGKELLLVTSPINPTEQGTLHGWQASNEERKFSDDQDAFSKLAFMLKAIGGFDLSDGSNVDYARALVSLSGKRFQSSVTWTARCSPDRDIYRINPETGAGEVVEGLKGCGQRYGLKAKVNKKTGEETLAFPKDDQGLWATRFECVEPCEASISPFLDLYNFRGVEAEGNGGDTKMASPTQLQHGKQQPITK